MRKLRTFHEKRKPSGFKTTPLNLLQQKVDINLVADVFHVHHDAQVRGAGSLLGPATACILYAVQEVSTLVGRWLLGQCFLASQGSTAACHEGFH
jgi:hypothetical protein